MLKFAACYFRVPIFRLCSRHITDIVDVVVGGGSGVFVVVVVCIAVGQPQNSPAIQCRRLAMCVFPWEPPLFEVRAQRFIVFRIRQHTTATSKANYSFTRFLASALVSRMRIDDADDATAAELHASYRLSTGILWYYVGNYSLADSDGNVNQWLMLAMLELTCTHSAIFL